MKMIVAIIKPFKLEDVRERLIELGIEGLTVTEVKGFGRQKGQSETYRNNEFNVNYHPKIKIEIAVPKKMEDKVVKAIQESANTGRIGDGKIFVFDLEKAVRIRTNEKGEKAL